MHMGPEKKSPPRKQSQKESLCTGSPLRPSGGMKDVIQGSIWVKECTSKNVSRRLGCSDGDLVGTWWAAGLTPGHCHYLV